MNSKSVVARMALTAVLVTLGHTPSSGAQPGTKAWDVATGGLILSSPALASDGTIYIASDDGKLSAVTPEGAVKWTFTINAPVHSSPSIGSDGTIYIGSMWPSNRLYAVDTNGLKKWEYATVGLIRSTAAIAFEGTICFTSQDGKLHALNPDGTLQWEASIGNQHPSSAAIAADGTIYVGSGHGDPALEFNIGELHALYPDGTRKWSFNARGPFSTPAIGAGGIIYVGSVDNEGKLYALDRQGHKLWEFRTGASIANSPVVGLDGTIYVATLGEVLWVINPDGTRKWTYHVRSPLNSTVAIGADNTIYIGANDVEGNIRALSTNGVQLWAFPTVQGYGGYSSPVIGPLNRIYFGALDRLYAVETAAPLAGSPWPMFQRDPRHTASVQSDVPMPAVAITNPVTGASVLPGQNIVIEAKTFGGAGGIANLDFFEGPNLLGRRTNTPYSLTWSNVPSGNYVLTAAVTDGSGMTNISGEVILLVNAPPRVNIITPTNAALFIARESILLNAAASDPDGTIARVEFFEGTNLLGRITNKPFALYWQNIQAGVYTLRAASADNWGAVATSAPVSIAVNARPVINIADPAQDTMIAAGSTLVINAEASDPDGMVTRVDFFDGLDPLGSAISEPFTLRLSAIPAGNYTLLAQAVDDRGATAFSTPVTLTAVPSNRPPIVSFDQPFDGAAFIQSSNIQLIATVRDSDGQVLAVEFFANDQLLVPTRSSNTYSAVWSSPPPGSHLLTVKVTDDLGAITSRQILVSVFDAANGEPMSMLPATRHRSTLWVPDGPVHALLETNGILYVGGGFNHIGQLVPGSAVVELSAEAPDLSYPLISGDVDIMIGDGEGGYFVGGLFNAVGQLARTNLVHVRADKTVDLDFRADANGHVTALALQGDSLFVGGEFTQIAGKPRRYLAAVDSRTGAVRDWNPDPDLWVSALATTSNAVYVGGNFRNIGTQARSYLAAIDPTTARATSWNPSVDDFVDQLVVAADRIYAVGQFRRANGQLRNGLAAFDRTTGATTSFNRFGDGGARVIAVVANVIYIGGTFTRMGGTDRSNLAALDAQSSTAMSWNPEVDGSVEAMAVLDDTIYIAGTFTHVAGQPRNRFAALDRDTGALLQFDLNASGRIFSLAESAGRVFGGGALGLIRLPRKGLAAIDAATGFATRWSPQCDGEVFALAAKGDTLYVGGGFSLLGGETRHSLGGINIETARVTAWNPGPATGIRALTVSGDVLFVGGHFGGLGNQFRNSLAAVDIRTGDVLPWNPDANDLVRAICVSSNVVYVGGNFTQLGGQPRNRIAALNLFTGKPTAWNPNPNGSVAAVVAVNDTLYVSGSFTAIGGQQRRSLAALDRQTGAATSWKADTGGSVIALKVSDELLFAGGQFTTMSGEPRINLAAADRRFGPPNAVDWDPRPGAEGPGTHVATLEVTPSTIYVGGNFTTVNGQNNPYLAAFDFPTRSESPLRLPNGFFQVNLIGPLGRIYVFEASTNLTDWIPVFTNRAPFVFEDLDAISYPHRFYRAIPAQ